MSTKKNASGEIIQKKSKTTSLNYLQAHPPSDYGLPPQSLSRQISGKQRSIQAWLTSERNCQDHEDGQQVISIQLLITQNSP